MTCTLHVAWDDRLVGYDFGPGHRDTGADPGPSASAGRAAYAVGARSQPDGAPHRPPPPDDLIGP